MPSSFFLMETLSPLYEDVQMSEVFSDSKYFVDCVPKMDTATILADYAKEKTVAGFNLKTFVLTHFQPPAETDNSYSSANKSLPDHLAGLWDVLTRTPDQKGGTLIPLPHPYIVPGGRFREVYYWDSYFTMLGLQVSKRVDIIENMINNFAYLIDTVGFIPNGNRSYYLGRSQPPFFALMLTVLMEEKGEDILFKYQSALEKEYAFWMDSADKLTDATPTHRRCVLMPDGSVMNRYWDDFDTPRPEAYIEDKHLAERSGRNAAEVYRHIRAAAESGWDFSSRWFRDAANMETIETTNIIPVDLNCLLCWHELMLAVIYGKTDKEKQRVLLAKMELRKKSLQKYFHNEEKGFYFDYHFTEAKQTEQYTLAGIFPFFLSIADYTQAEAAAKVIEEKFLQPGGLLTTLNQTGQQWDSPNGWAPLQWVTYYGLKKFPYHQHNVAAKIKANWMHTNEKVFTATGKMMEKYNVTDTENKAGGGEYPNQDGFGWTNGVYLKFLSEGL